MNIDFHVHGLLSKRKDFKLLYNCLKSFFDIINYFFFSFLQQDKKPKG